MRRAGILLHISSLPSRGPIGDLGPAAHAFADWLAEAGCSSWQVLPLNPMGPALCPYASPSAMASEPLLISLDALVEQGLLEPFDAPHTAATDETLLHTWKRPLLEKAAARVTAEVVDDWADAHPWGEAWARFKMPESPRIELALQALFDQQWAALRAHCDVRGVELIGDVPIFVSGDGCDATTRPELFDHSVSTGVPPDYFSKTGQLWGNPHYDWDAHRAEGFTWWKARMERALEHCHTVRLDHFRGFAAAWAVARGAENAIEGTWTPGPAAELFDALGPMPLIAEDLGVITPDVEALRQHIGAPGMKILQFAFGGDGSHAFLPHNFPDSNWVAYTGTHDNETARGWYESAPEAARHRFRVMQAVSGHDCAWDLIRMTWSSTADRAIAQLQDVLDLGSAARMNTPGTIQGNWGWRMPHPAPRAAAERLRELAWAFGRLPPG
jgi:4-alpha-glucanotransferase